MGGGLRSGGRRWLQENAFFLCVITICPHTCDELVWWLLSKNKCCGTLCSDSGGGAGPNGVCARAADMMGVLLEALFVFFFFFLSILHQGENSF